MYHEKQYEDKVVVGNIDPGGSVLNHNGLNISTKGLESGGFEVSLHTLNTNLPIVIACPHWFTGGKSRYPQNIAQLALTIWNPTLNTFKVNLGIPFDSINRKHLGFSFAAFDPDFDQPGVVVGSVIQSKSGIYINGGKNFTVSSANITYPSQAISVQELKDVFGKTYPDTIAFFDRSGIEKSHATKITFNTKFSDVPTMIVTPFDTSPSLYSSCRPYWDLTVIQVRSCLVEHITNSEALVKCGCVLIYNATIDFEPMGFNFVAMGPQG